ncbi:hypothetical protein [uncultured Vibrio sp.]|uniref:hypothetical protein n=1 Tax=uncultured Vibrio sp. TaxID=114054 RepID=UPI0025DC8880|nr:hypothetical protein [uncultured Vibrio sp.]
MRYKTLSTLIFLMVFFAPVHAESNTSEQTKSTLVNWQANIEFLPLDDTHNSDVINLVPKQSIMMKAYVWYPKTKTWIVKYPNWDMPGASIEKLTTPVANLSREDGAVGQYGHTQNYIVTPVDIGHLKLSQSSIDVSPYQDGSERLALPKDLTLNIELPDGVYSLERFLPAYSLDVNQEFYLYTNDFKEELIDEKQVSELVLKKGDMLERRVTIEAKGIKGSSIPRLSVSDNFANEQTQTKSKDINGIFGFEGGEQVSSFFYSPQQGGRVTLDPINIEWWSIKDKSLKTSALTGVSFGTTKVDAYEDQIALNWWQKQKGMIYTFLFYGVVAAPFLSVSFILLKSLLRKTNQWMTHAKKEIGESEWLLFIRLLVSVLFGGKKRQKRLFTRWQFLHLVWPIGNELLTKVNAIYGYDSKQRSGNLNRLQKMLLCINIRQSKIRKQDKRLKYQLPML